MYRLLPFLLIITLIAFAPAALPAQQDKDKDKDKTAEKDKDKTPDKDKDKPADKEKEKPADKEKEKEKEPAKTNGAGKPPETKMVFVPEGSETNFGYWSKINVLAAGIAPLANVFILAIIAVILIGLRSDIGRLEEKIGKGEGTPPAPSA
jgi:hypothetical protein